MNRVSMELKLMNRRTVFMLWNRQKHEYLRIVDALLPASKKK